MARTYTSINHSALSSDTLADANDAIQALFWRLLCIADDWGRFPNNPAKVKRMMQDYNHTVDQIKESINYFIERGSLSNYQVDDNSICEWNKWDEYQTLKWKNEAQWPNREGEYESSTNPLSGQGAKRNHKSKQIKSNQIKSNGGTLELSLDKSKDEPKGDKAVKIWIDLYREIIGKDFIITPVLAKHITNAFKTLKKDLNEFENRVRACLESDWYQENEPGPAYFYRNINKFSSGDDLPDSPSMREEMKVPYICTKCGGKFKVTRYKDEPDDRIFRPENCPDCSQDLVTKGTLRHDPDRGGHNG